MTLLDTAYEELKKANRPMTAKQLAENIPADDEGNREGNGTNVGTNDTNAEERLFEYIRENPHLSMNDLVDKISVSRRTVARMIDCLKGHGRIRRVGGTRGHWEVLT